MQNASFLAGKKTYIGILVAMIPAILRTFFGYDVSDAFPVEFALLADELFEFVGAGIAIYGRMVAQTPGWLVKK